MVSSPRFLLTLLMGSLWLSAGLSQAATYFVTPSGGQGGCSTNTNSPQNGLNNGIGCLGSGDTLILKSGTYGERVDDAIPSGATLRAEVSRGAIVQPNGGSSPVIWIGRNTARSSITLDGLVLDGSQTSAPIFALQISDNSSSGISILNMEIRHFPNLNSCSPGNNTVGIGVGAQSGLTLRGNHIHHIGEGDADDPGGCPSGQHYFYSYGTYFPANNSVIENNEIDHCSSYPIHGYPQISSNVIRNNYLHDNGGPALLSEVGNNQFYNNVLANNSGNRAGGNGGMAMGGGGNNNNLLIANNTIMGNGGACMVFSDPVNNSRVQNNICRDNGSDTIQSAGGSGNTIDTNLCQGGTVQGCALYPPDPGIGSDYHLLPGSQARDKGVNLNGLFTTDKDGTVRGSSWDLGAYEFGGGTTLPAPTNLRLLGITNP